MNNKYVYTFGAIHLLGYFKVPISCLGILNLWILLRKIVGRKSLKKLSDENVIFMDFFAGKFDEVTSK